MRELVNRRVVVRLDRWAVILENGFRGWSPDREGFGGPELFMDWTSARNSGAAQTPGARVVPVIVEVREVSAEELRVLQQKESGQ